MSRIQVSFACVTMKLILRLIIAIICVYFIYAFIWHQLHFTYIQVDGNTLKIPSYTLQFRTNKILISDALEDKVISWRKQSVATQNVELKSKIAITTMYARPKHHSDRSFDEFAPFALANMLEYSHYHGYPLFFMHSENILNSTSVSSVYWSKLSILEWYLDKGFDWILWTDIDVFFIDKQQSLSHFTDQVPSNYHFIGVLECGRTLVDYIKTAIRSGFFFLRNSAETRKLLLAWKKLQLKYINSLTPEQHALEDLFVNPTFSSLFYIYPTRHLHAYSECMDKSTFSVHFPNTERKMCMKQWFHQLFSHLNPVFIK